MKYKKILALAGAAMVMSAVTGCSSQKEEEPETLVISDMEVVSEDSTGSELSETETGAQELELDLSAETQTEPAPPETFTEPESETQTEAQTESQTSVTVQKPGEEETEEETTAGSDTEAETGDKNSSSPAGRKDKKPSKPKKKPESERETQVSSETQKASESQTQSETQKVSESQEQSETQKVTQGQSETQAQTATEAESETQPETQTETEAESETQPETQTETEAESETQPETQTETEAESETQPETQTDTEAESETQPETQTETAAESETQAQTETEPESETEAKAQSEAQDEFTQELKYVNDRVNVRKAASEQADIQALLTPGMHVLALSEQTGWIHVRYETDEGFAEGYIKAEYLSDASAVCTVKETINIRAEASMDSEKIGKFAAGETVIVISEKNGWSEIRYTQANESVNAYVKSEFLESIGAEDMSAKERLINGEAQTETETESEIQSETQSESETESEAQSEAQPESEESESEQLASEEDVKWENAVQAQFELAKEFSPQMQSVGIIYSETNQDAKAQIQEYTQLASEYGIGLVTDTIEAEVDIDLIVSEMAGNVDAIFCMEDEMVTGLIQTVRAYADEVGIPVLGMDSAQVEQGCVAAYEDGILYWNAEEADKLGLTYDGLPVDEVKEY